MKSERGNAVVEFVLVLPWLVGILVAAALVPVWIMAGKLFFFAAFKGARSMAVYEKVGAQNAVAVLSPGSEIIEVDEDGFLHLKREKTDLALEMKTKIPVSFALKKESLDLSNQGRRDSRGHPLMDNPIFFCGRQGDYHLCAP